MNQNRCLQIIIDVNHKCLLCLATSSIFFSVLLLFAEFLIFDRFKFNSLQFISLIHYLYYFNPMQLGLLIILLFIRFFSFLFLCYLLHMCCFIFSSRHL